jgi:hypothetical protein
MGQTVTLRKRVARLEARYGDAHTDGPDVIFVVGVQPDGGQSVQSALFRGGGAIIREPDEAEPSFTERALITAQHTRFRTESNVV